MLIFFESPLCSHLSFKVFNVLTSKREQKRVNHNPFLMTKTHCFVICYEETAVFPWISKRKARWMFCTIDSESSDFGKITWNKIFPSRKENNWSSNTEKHFYVLRASWSKSYLILALPMFSKNYLQIHLYLTLLFCFINIPKGFNVLNYPWYRNWIFPQNFLQIVFQRAFLRSLCVLTFFFCLDSFVRRNAASWSLQAFRARKYSALEIIVPRDSLRKHRFFPSERSNFTNNLSANL